MTASKRFDSHGIYQSAVTSDRTRQAGVFLPDCWLAHHGRFEGGRMPSCEGRLVKVHLIPRQKLERELGEDLGGQMVEDPRTWVWACGGIMGNAGHHGAFDSSRKLRVPWSEIPVELKELCRTWEKRRLWRGALLWLELEYRRRAVPMAHRGAHGADGDA